MLLIPPAGSGWVNVTSTVSGGGGDGLLPRESPDEGLVVIIGVQEEVFYIITDIGVVWWRQEDEFDVKNCVVKKKSNICERIDGRQSKGNGRTHQLLII